MIDQRQHKPPADFTADSFAETYNGHIGALVEIKKKSARAYHHKLETLFISAQWVVSRHSAFLKINILLLRGGRRVGNGANVTANILDGMDLDGIENDIDGDTWPAERRALVLL